MDGLPSWVQKFSVLKTSGGPAPLMEGLIGGVVDDSSDARSWGL